MVSLSDPGQLRALLGQPGPPVAQPPPSAPSSQSDLFSLASAIDEQKSALADAGYRVAQMPSALVIKLHSPEVMAAMSRLDAYVTKSC